MSYKGKIDLSTLQNPSKFKNDPKNLKYDSLWERQLIMWADANPMVVAWSCQSPIIKYFNPVKKQPARYIIDFYLEFKDGRQLLVEVKPHKERNQPVLTESKMTKTGKPTARFKREMDTYQVNQEKWRMAEKFAKDNGMEFYVFDEHTLDKLGIRRITPKNDKVLKKTLAIENKRWRNKPKKAKRPKSSIRKKKK